MYHVSAYVYYGIIYNVFTLFITYVVYQVTGVAEESTMQAIYIYIDIYIIIYNICYISGDGGGGGVDDAGPCRGHTRPLRRRRGVCACV